MGLNIQTKIMPYIKTKDSELFEIALIKFAFTNSLLIRVLQERGTAIREHNQTKLVKCNNQIQELLNNEDRLNELRRPCSAYITF